MDERKICSICGQPIDESTGYVEGKLNEVYVCAKCVGQLGKLWAKSVGIELYDPSKTGEGDSDGLKEGHSSVMTPRDIKAVLDEYIIGQDEAKKRISVAVYNHYKRLDQDVIDNDVEEDVVIQKSNVLLLGPSGSGKTLIAQTVAKLLDVPFAMCDATSLTESGYVGDDVETIISKLLAAADYDVQRAQRGIIFLDEFDKISRKGGSASITRDVSGEGVQQGLLKLIEGTVVGVHPHGGRKHPDQPLIQVDTKDILFICAGAFEGLDKKVAARMNMRSVGYAATGAREKAKDMDILDNVTPNDLRSFGLIPEIIGRLPVITHTNELTADDMKKILIEPRNSIVKQYKKLFSMDSINMTIDDDAIDAIVKKTMDNETGARGLRNVMEDVMQEAMFSMPGKTVLPQELHITREFVEKELYSDAA